MSPFDLRRGVALLLALAALRVAGLPAQQATQDGVLARPAAAVDQLRPGDVVRLRIWREPDLSGDFMVDESGVVTLPRVGPVRVLGEPVDSLKAHLLALYRRYVNQPSIEVTPLRRVQVTGAVRTPGLYTVDPTMSVADAIALAGGITPDGRRDRVLLIRGNTPIDAELERGDGRASPLRSGDAVYVPQRSWLSRNPGMVIAAVSATASVVWAFRRR